LKAVPKLDEIGVRVGLGITSAAPSFPLDD
jgi:hypothetical protein